MGELISFFFNQCWQFLALESPWFGFAFWEIYLGASVIAIAIWAIRSYFSASSGITSKGVRERSDVASNSILDFMQSRKGNRL